MHLARVTPQARTNLESLIVAKQSCKSVRTFRSLAVFQILIDLRMRLTDSVI